MRRGEIWWAELGRPRGSEPGYRRPVVVLQSNEFNESRIRTVVVASMSSNLSLAQAPGNVFCPKRTSGLSKPSVINVSQVATVDKARLAKKVAELPAGVLSEVEAGVRLVLDL